MHPSLPIYRLQVTDAAPLAGHQCLVLHEAEHVTLREATLRSAIESERGNWTTVYAPDGEVVIAAAPENQH